MKKILLMILFIVFPYVAYAQEGAKYTQVIDGTAGSFKGGIENTNSKDRLTPGRFYDCSNIRTDEDLGLERKDGTQKVMTLPNKKSPRFIYEYIKANGSRYQILVAGATMYYHPGDFTPIVMSTVSSVGNWTAQTVNDNCYLFSDTGTDKCHYFDGTTTTESSVPPHFKYSAIWNNVIWGAGDFNAPSYLYRCYIDTNGVTNPLKWTSLAGISYIDYIGANNGQKITWLAVFNGNLDIFKERSAYVGYGTIPGWSLQCVNESVGCTDGHGVQQLGNELIVPTHRGIEGFNGYSFTLKSEHIKQTIDGMTQVNSDKLGYSFLDTTAADFGAGSLTRVSSTSVSGDIRLAITSHATSYLSINKTSTLTSEASLDSVATGVYGDALGTSVITGSKLYMATRFRFTTNNYTLTKISIYMSNYNVTSSPILLYIYGDDGTNTGIGTQLTSQVTLPASSISSSASDVDFTLTSPIELQKNTYYWIVLYSAAWAEGEGHYYNIRIDQSETGYYYNTKYLTTWTKNADQSIRFNAYGYYYPASETYDTQITTANYHKDFGVFTSSQTLNGQGITYQIGTASTVNGTYTYSSITSGSIIEAETNNFFKVRATLTSDGYDTATLHELYVVWYDTINLRGTFTSQAHSISGIKTFGDFVSSNIPEDQTITYKVATSSYATGGFTYTTQANNSLITISTGTYMKWQAIFDTSYATRTPSIQDAQVNYYKTSDFAPMCSGVIKQRYYLGYAGPGVTVNNKVLLIDKNGAFINDTGSYASMGTYRNGLYAGSSANDGNIFWLERANIFTDSGTTVSAFWESGDMDMGYPNQVKIFDEAWIDFKSVDNGSLAFAYSLDGDTTTTSITLSGDSDEEYLQERIKFPISVTTGKTIRYKVSSNNDFNIRRIETTFRTKKKWEN